MKKVILIYFLGFILILQGCEEVVEIDLMESEPRLVVDASILLPKNNPEA